MTRDHFNQALEVGDVVRLLSADPPNDYALVEGDLEDGTVMVRRFDRAKGEWHATRRRWGTTRVQRDLHRGCKVEGQRGNPAFVDRLREW